MIVISDLHIGCTRQGGTTPQSQQALRDYVRANLVRILETTREDHVVVNGDLLDNFSIDVSEVIKTYEIFADWLHTSNGKLTLISGNHDASAKADRTSSFHLLAHFLQARFPDQVFVIDHTRGMTAVHGNVWAISHCLNQDLFNLELEKAFVKPPEGSYLLLHANVKNTFSESSDHSLNINDEQLGNLMRAGWCVVVAHEHQQYELRGGRVIVVGNQVPTSISDCIGETSKRAIIIDEDGHRFIDTWQAADSYAEVDWQDLTDVDAQFIRVVGEASAEQAADVVKAISALRQRSSAFVVGNAVKIAGMAGIDDMATDSIESIKAFDVMAAIYAELNDNEIKIVKELVNAQ